MGETHRNRLDEEEQGIHCLRSDLGYYGGTQRSTLTPPRCARRTPENTWGFEATFMDRHGTVPSTDLQSCNPEHLQRFNPESALKV
jgi:hypothetical protein